MTSAKDLLRTKKCCSALAIGEERRPSRNPRADRTSTGLSYRTHGGCTLCGALVSLLKSTGEGIYCDRKYQVSLDADFLKLETRGYM